MQARIKIAQHPGYLEIPVGQSRWADIVVGILCCHRPVSIQWVKAMQNLKPPPHARVETIAIQSRPYNPDVRDSYDWAAVADSRNRIAEQACQMGARYLFFVDDDVEVPTDALLTLLSVLQTRPEVKVCSGVYVDKAQPRSPALWDINKQRIYQEAQGPFEIGWSGIFI